MDGVATTTGFWVQHPDLGETPSDARSYMSCDLGSLFGLAYPEKRDSKWATTDNFESLFEKFLVNPADPALLLITGNITSGGVATFGDTYTVSAGVPDPSSSSASAYTLNLIDASGNLLGQTSFDVPFSYSINGQTLPLTQSFFSLGVPFAQGAQKITLSQSGKLLAQTNVESLLLGTVIRNLPSSAFDLLLTALQSSI